MKKIIIEVKENHITNGEAGQPKFCPVALAIKEKLKINDHDQIKVYGSQFVINEEKWIDLPPIVEDFVSNFDVGGFTTFKPFSFEIKISRFQLFKAKFLTWLKK